jgi:hypothetical protein
VEAVSQTPLDREEAIVRMASLGSLSDGAGHGGSSARSLEPEPLLEGVPLGRAFAG